MCSVATSENSGIGIVVHQRTLVSACVCTLENSGIDTLHQTMQVSGQFCFAVSGILGALKSKRNVVGVGSATILPLIKRKLMQEIERLGHDAAGEQETA